MSQLLSKLLSDLAASGLITAREQQTLSTASANVEPQALLRKFVGSGRLTEYQSELLLAGRGRELRIGNYLLIDKLGEGGMGTVYKAVHVLLGRDVAVKTIRPAIAGRQAIQRFQQEIEALGRLNHPHVVRATNAGEEQGTWFLVMDFVAGVDLAELCRRLGPMRTEDACEIVRQVAVGLEYIHQCGLVHRDIKPSNLMVTREGTVRILDLGLARLQQGESLDRRLTAEGQILGTVDYMAPEQAAGEGDIDIRADLYSLGCLLFRLLAGCVPYGSPRYAGRMERLLAHINDPFPDVKTFRPDLPDTLINLISRLVAKRPDARWATPAVVAKAIEPHCSGVNLRELMTAEALAEPLAKAYRSSPTVPGPGEGAERATPGTHSGDRRNRHRAAVIVVAAVFLLAAGLLLSRGMFNRSSSSGSQSEQTGTTSAKIRAPSDVGDDRENGPVAATIDNNPEEVAPVSAERTPAEQARFDRVSRLAKRISQSNSIDRAGFEEFLTALAEVQTQSDRVFLLQLSTSTQAPEGGAADLLTNLHLFVDTLIGQRQTEPAVSLLNAAVEFAPDSLGTRMKRAQLASARGDTVAALADYDEVLRRDPANVAALNKRGVARATKGDYESAIADFTEAIRLDGDAGDYYARGNAWRITKALDRAIADYDETLRRSPEHALALKHRGMSWSAKGDHDRAIADFNELIRLDPKSAAALNDRAVEWHGKREYDKAIADYTEAIRLDPAFALAYANRGRIWSTKNEYEKALADFDESIRIAPRADAYLSRGAIWQSRNDYEQAIADFDQALALQISDPTAPLLRLGQVLSSKGDLDRALAELNFAIAKNGRSPEAFNNRGHLRLDQKDFDGAISDFDSALRIHAHMAQAYCGRARARFAKGNCPESLEDFEAALKIEALPYVQIQFAAFLATCPDETFRDGPRAFELARAAIDQLQAATPPSYYDTLAAACAENGAFEIAVQAQRIAIESRPKIQDDEVLRLTGHTDKISSLAISADGEQLLSGSDDRTMRLWNLETGESLRVFEGHTNFVLSVAFSPDGKQALTGSGGGFRENEFMAGNDRSLRLWDLATGGQLVRLPAHGAPLWNVGFLDGAQRVFSVTGSGESILRIWDLETQKEVRRIGALQHSGQGVAVSPDQKRIVTAGNPPDLVARIWDVESGRELLRLQGHTTPIRGAAWSQDGKHILTAAGAFGAANVDTALRLWDADTGRELRQFKGHPKMIWCVAFSPNGAWALSGSVDGTVRLWDVATGNALRRFRGHLTTEASLTGGHRADVRTVLFTPDGRRAISGAHDKTIRVWKLPE